MEMPRVGAIVLGLLAGVACTGRAAGPPDSSRQGSTGRVETAEFSPAPLRPRAAHTATLLADGRVLLVGGCATDGCARADVAPTSEFYLPGRGFAAGPPLVEARSGHTATLLPDGRVLVVGGWAREGTPPLAAAEVYDPATGRFAPVGALREGRGGHAAAALPDGRVLIVGGWIGSRRANASAELFDPATNRFTPAAPLPAPRLGPLATPLADGSVLVVGGQDESRAPVAELALYDPATDRWRPAGTLATPRFKSALAPLADGRLLLLGGTVDDRQLLASGELCDPAAGRCEPGPTMEMGRYKFTAARVDGRVVVVGGSQAAVLAGESFHPLPSTRGPWRSFATATPLPGGDLLIVGGYDEKIALHPDARLVRADEITAAAAGVTAESAR